MPCLLAWWLPAHCFVVCFQCSHGLLCGRGTDMACVHRALCLRACEAMPGLIQSVIFSFASRFLKKYINTQLSRGDVCNFFKMSGELRSSATSESQCGSAIRLHPAKTSHHLSISLRPNTIRQCHMKAERVFQDREGAQRKRVLVVVQYRGVSR